jgi:CheY-like chemotaxis protein
VVTARKGQEAVESFDSAGEDISIVVSNIVMPQMGGFALYQSLRVRNRDVKMLFVTDHPLEGESQNMLGKGEAHWLQKLFSANEFITAV